MKRIGVVVIGMMVMLGSCATAKNNIVFSPIPQTIPTSASSSLYYDDTVWTKDDYLVIKEFSFEKSESVRLVDKKNTINFSFYKELEELKRENGADAIVDLKIEWKSVSHLDSDLILLERYGGFIGVTLILYGIDAIMNPELAINEPMELFIPGGVVTTVCYGGSLVHEHFGKSTYKYIVSGKLVRYK